MFRSRQECSALMLGQHRIFPLAVAFGFKMQSQQYVFSMTEGALDMYHVTREVTALSGIAVIAENSFRD